MISNVDISLFGMCDNMRVSKMVAYFCSLHAS